ncbi:PAS domain-containing sensor histidine kinase [Arcobacter sp. FWKO B]|uniref:PAS domain-containing sensor histidine kinase n=1 Tax=Arcobacter sp. FWKO B TaxID=2593672 RepID=UPI0019084896|nr:PAS domain-containing sensor histidine kinase [Arcobacter sp. FWKO B]
MSIDMQKLQQSNNELREIVNNSWDGIGIIDKESKFIYVNNAFSPILGYPKEELLTINFHTIMPSEIQNTFLSLIEKTLHNQYQNEMEVSCLRKDKQTVYLQITLAPMLNKKFFVINAKDITRQKSDAQILNKYVISAHFDIDGKFTKASEAFYYISGYSKDELLTKNYWNIKKDTDKDSFEIIKLAIEQNGYYNGKEHFLKKDESTFWVDIKTQPVHNKYGDIIGYTALMFDITNELTLKNQNTALSKEVTNAKDEIKQKDKILVEQTKLAIMAETLQMISHQWRQPLNIISIKAQKMELDFSFGNEINPDEIVHSLDEIKQTAEELSKTIEDFQNFVELKDYKTKTTPKQVITKAVEIFSNSPDSQKIDFIKDIEKDIEFETYPNELSTILVNILTNAKEAIIRNNTKNGVIKLKEELINDHMVIEISDNGGGIPENIIDKIFEPYFSTKDSMHGVGLGLYACKIIVETHLNGKIEAFNHSSGATIKISLPIE